MRRAPTDAQRASRHIRKPRSVKQLEGRFFYVLPLTRWALLRMEANLLLAEHR
jgi:hypothetical protein